MFEHFNTALQAGLTKAVFDHARNYLICAFILAVGTNELKNQASNFFGLVQSDFSGVGVIAIACALMLLNLFDGIRQIVRFRYHTVWVIGLVALYAYLSIRIVEIAWNFRVAA
jgi:hypothetical protein